MKSATSARETLKPKTGLARRSPRATYAGVLAAAFLGLVLTTILGTSMHSYGELPKVIDPPSGWVQNSNSAPWYAPWYMTMPFLNPNDYPPYMSLPFS